jgi:hypothetical protein
MLVDGGANPENSSAGANLDGVEVTRGYSATSTAEIGCGWTKDAVKLKVHFSR